jgi:hypothetical protein
MIYTPLLAVVLAPVVGFTETPLPWARALMAAFVAVGLGAIVRLVARRGGWTAGAAAAALALAPFDLTFWHLLVRVDGPMIAAWLVCALWLVPERLARGSDRLERGRLVLGAAALLAAIAFKPTALILAAPMVGAWFLVDRASAWRLAGLLAAVGLVLAGALQVATDGGFAWSLGLYRHHPRFGRQVGVLVTMFLRSAWPLVVAAGAGFVWASWRRRAPWRDGAIVLLAGGLLLTPALAKAGAYWSYLLPLVGALAVAAGRWLGPGERGSSRLLSSCLGHLSIAAVALALAATRPFPLPDRQDEATAEYFYAYVREVASEGPVFAARPDYAYFVAGQPVVVAIADLAPLLMARVPGVVPVLEGLASRRYALVILSRWAIPRSRLIDDGLRGYAPVGECRLGSYLGPLPYRLLVQPGIDRPFAPPPDVDCRAGPTSGR